MAASWILVGMMGAGKSSVGRALAAASGRKFVDTDILLQHRFGRPVHSIFGVYGEEAFRQHETSMLRSLEPDEAVLATGGGIVTRDENWVELRRLGTVIYLEAPAEVLVERLSKSKKRRPLLETENWQDKVRDLLETRRPYYEKADIRVPLDVEDVEAVAQRVLQALKEREAA